jgi:hypothetical protein
MSLTTQIRISAAADLSLTSALSTRFANARLIGDFALASGIEVGSADAVIATRHELIASGTAVVTLSDFTSPVRRAAALAAVKFIMLKAASGNAGPVTVKPNSTRPWIAPFNAASDVLRIEPGGCALLANHAADGWLVDAGTADRLYIENLSGADATLDVIILGTSGVPVVESPTFDSTSITFDSTDYTWDSA